MMTVHEVARRTGVSIRTLHHYDQIGLLKATSCTEAGYRLYDDAALERLQQILFFKELEFSLKDIKAILDSPNFDPKKALQQQIELMELQKEHLEGLIVLARHILTEEDNPMSFEAFDTKKMDAYSQRAKETWGQTEAYKEYETKSAGRSKVEQNTINQQMMAIFEEFGNIKLQDPSSTEAGTLVRKLQQFITEHYYQCTDEILLSLGEMYVASDEFKANIDKVGGEGTAVFVSKAVKALLAEK